MTEATKHDLILAVPSTIAAIGTLWNRNKLGDIGVKIDGVFAKFVKTARKEAKAAGVKQEHDREK